MTQAAPARALALWLLLSSLHGLALLVARGELLLECLVLVNQHAPSPVTLGEPRSKPPNLIVALVNGGE